MFEKMVKEKKSMSRFGPSGRKCYTKCFFICPVVSSISKSIIGNFLVFQFRFFFLKTFFFKFFWKFGIPLVYVACHELYPHHQSDFVQFFFSFAQMLVWKIRFHFKSFLVCSLGSQQLICQLLWVGFQLFQFSGR